jgi:basic amino acid/polyamine antiporter, APA family
VPEPRSYKTPFYPYTPIIFIIVASWLVLNTLMARPVESTVGLVLIASGIPLYLVFRRRRAQANSVVSGGT